MTDLYSFSIEDVVRTSGDMAVRRRFDARNLVILFLLTLFFTIVACFEFAFALGSQKHGWPNVVISTLTILLCNSKCSAANADVEKFRDRARQEDDLTVVVARIV